MNKRNGFTLIEIIVTMALLVILLGIGVVALNPGGQLASARNTERTLHLQTIMNAVRQNIADQSGQSFSCSSGPLPTSSRRMTSLASATSGYNIAPCLVPVYMFSIPFDPSTSSAHFNSVTDYDTGYKIMQNSSTGQITLSAPAAELGKNLFIIR